MDLSKNPPTTIRNERDEALALHFMLLARQLTSLSDCLMHIFRLPLTSSPEDEESLFKAFASYSGSELADIIAQVKRLCVILGLDFKEIEKMGDIRYEEKRREFLEKYPKGKWV